MLTRTLAFVRRDLSIQLSYRFQFVMQFVGMITGLASFYFVSKLLGTAANPYLEQYGGDYFGYVLVGLAFLGFQSVGLGSFASAITSAQSTGTLEAMLVTPTRLSDIMLSSSAWDFLWTGFNVVLYLSVGALLFGADVGSINVLAAAAVLVLTVAVFSAAGILAASAIMVLKRGNPIAWLFGGISTFIGGTYFPVTVFPEWLQKVAHIFPVFYGLRAMRLAVLTGASVSDLSGDLIALAGFAIVLIPVSFMLFKYAVRVAKTDGTLGTY